VVTQVKTTPARTCKAACAKCSATTRWWARFRASGWWRHCKFAEDKATRKRFANENDIAWRCRTIGFEEGLIIRSTLGR
jgi:adenosylmethionine-8-amino-7-oxononanoate aminotransferase